jgi:hypothetical protein
MVVKSQINFNLKYLLSLSMPSRIARACYFLMLSLFSYSCGSFTIPGTSKNQSLYKGSFESLTKLDFADHLASLRGAFLGTPGTKIINNRFASTYLKEITGEILAKNEIFFKEKYLNLNNFLLCILYNIF